VQSFYVKAYHLKDDIRIGAPLTAASAVEAAVSDHPDLALLCDLANLVKHGRLDRPPRSGYVPSFVSWAGRQLPGEAETNWRLDLVIEHNGITIDGLDFVQRSVAAWRQVLDQWGLV
jgi:hypothetical protein